MKQAEQMKWTDGAGKALASLGAIITKAEKARYDDSEEYFSDPEIMVMDMLTSFLKIDLLVIILYLALLTLITKK